MDTPQQAAGWFISQEELIIEMNHKAGSPVWLCFFFLLMAKITTVIPEHQYDLQSDTYDKLRFRLGIPQY